MKRYILDTNHLAACFDRVTSIRERIVQVRRLGTPVGTCVPALCELQCRIHYSQRREHNQQSLRHLLGHIRVWPLPLEMGQIYGEVYAELKAKGSVLSQVDMMLAAMARHGNLTILTSDRDFESLTDIKKENWL